MSDPSSIPCEEGCHDIPGALCSCGHCGCQGCPCAGNPPMYEQHDRREGDGDEFARRYPYADERKSLDTPAAGR